MRDEKGQIVVMAIFLLMILFSLAGLVVDLGKIYSIHQELKNACDAASLAGAFELPNSEKAKEVALEYASKNKVLEEEVEVTTPYTDKLIEERGFPSTSCIKVKVTRDVKLFFAKLFGLKTCKVKAESVASFPFFSVRWKFDTGQEVHGTPVVYKGVLYAVNTDDFYKGQVYALEPETGKEIWHTQVYGAIQETPYIVNDTIYFATLSGWFYALDLSGNVKWRVYTKEALRNVYPGGRNQCHWISSSPTYLNGIIYIGSHSYDYNRSEWDMDDGGLYAISATTGNFVDQACLPGPIYSSPVIVNNILYVGCSDGNMYAINIRPNGTFTRGGNPYRPDIKWKYQTGGEVSSTPCVWNGKVYFGSDDNKIYCLDALTGAKIWSYETPPPQGSGPYLPRLNYVGSGKVSDKGILHIGDGGGWVYALDAETGVLKWKRKLAKYSIEGSPCLAHGVVYYGADNRDAGGKAGMYHALSEDTGKILQSYNIGYDTHNSPIATEDWIYFGADDHKVYGVKITPPEGIYARLIE
ncbi:MAG: PQQ-binding-like beta-propeller repeat protein [bacterium]|nr:PQQ-binding-like beta-propeller repeat protein [bacterium]